MTDFFRQLFSLRDIMVASLNLGVATALAVLIAWVYRRTYSDLVSPPRFSENLVAVAMITAMTIMVIGGNLVLSLGLVGALSIVRFRAPIKDPRDIVFLFWAISVGLAAGSGAHMVAIVGSVLIGAVLLVLARDFPLLRTDPSYLVVLRGEDLPLAEVEGIVGAMTKRCRVRLKSATDNHTEVIYEVDLEPDGEESLLSALRPLAPSATINLLSHSGESAL